MPLENFESSILFFTLLSSSKNISKIKNSLVVSPAILTSNDFVRSNEIVRTKWPIYQVIRHFVLTI